MLSPRAKRSIYHGWWVVLVIVLVHFYNGGVYNSGFTALINPLVEEFGWSYAVVSLAVTFRGLEGGAMAPIVGIFVDRFGPKRLMLWGIAITGLGFFLFSRVHTLWTFYVTFAIIALGSSLASAVTGMTAVARWFTQRRTLAMGFLTTGYAAGGLLVPAVVWLIDRFTWRTALLAFGVGTWLWIIPVALVVRRPPGETYSTEKKMVTSGVGEKLEGLTARQVLRKSDFWLLSTAVFFGHLAASAVVAHQVPYMVSIGISRQTAGFLAIAFASANIVGRLGIGWLGDMIDKRRCFAIAVLIQAVGSLVFALATSVGQFVPGLVMLGIGFGGSIPLRPVLQTEFFGMKAFGAVQGLLVIFGTAAAMASPLFAGWMFDLRGSYRPAFLILAAATFISVPIILAIRRRASEGFENS